MAERIEALVVPQLVSWCRKTAFMTVEEAAQKIGVHTDKLIEWESGLSRPSMPQAKSMARIYKRPLAIFYLPEAPKEPKIPHNFRRLPEGDTRISPRLAFELRYALYRREEAIDLTLEQDEIVAPFSLSYDKNESVNNIAHYIREKLGITFQEQHLWRDPDIAVKHWIRAVESLGILVFQTDSIRYGVLVQEMRGVSFYFDTYPIILLNGLEKANPKIFTLIHELCHLVLHTDGICDIDLTSSEDIEVMCNAVSGEVLVPESYLRNMDVLAHNIGIGLLDDVTHKLAREFSVSRWVILRRLLTLNYISQSIYAEKDTEFRSEFFYHEVHLQKSSGGPLRHHMAMRNNGPRYTGIVLDAFNYGTISAMEACRHLGLHYKHWDNLVLAYHGIDS